MSFNLILLWAQHESDGEFVELKKVFDTEFSNQFNVQICTTTKDAIDYYTKKTSRPTIIIAKLGQTKDTLAQPLIETIRRNEARTFIILHSHTACADPNLR